MARRDSCNGFIRAEINRFGWLTFKNAQGAVLLEERWRVKDGGEKTSALEIPGRELKPILGGDFRITQRFEPNDKEHIFGLGQRQEPNLDMKGCMLELAHRNSQASVLFALSSRGYGILWNNPSIGSVTFANNVTTWVADGCLADVQPAFRVRRRERNMAAAHARGTPVMRPFFYDFPNEPECWVSTTSTCSVRTSWFHRSWRWDSVGGLYTCLAREPGRKEVHSGDVNEEGESIVCDAPLERLPVFVREGRGLALFTPERGS